MSEKLYHRCGVCFRVFRGQIEMSRDKTRNTTIPEKALCFTVEEWKNFIKAVKDGDFDMEYLNRFIQKKEFKEKSRDDYHKLIKRTPRESTKFLEHYLNEIGEVIKVKGFMVRDVYWTLFKDKDDNTISVSGFSWGSGGETASIVGLYKTLQSLGFSCTLPCTMDKINSFKKSFTINKY